MKKKILIILTICLCVAAALGIYFQSRMKQAHIWVSLPDEKGNWHQVKTDIAPHTDSRYLIMAMDLLQNGIKERGLLPVFPEEVGYYSVSVQDGYAVEINFKYGYLQMPQLQRGLCETAMIRSFTTFPEISKLYLYEEGIPIVISGNADIFGLDQGDAYLSLEESLQKTVSHIETLYFYRPQTGKLVAEKQTIVRQAYEPRGKAILKALIKGSRSNELIGLLSETMQVNDVKIRNQVCYVDFNQDFVKEYADMGTNRRLMIYSIVNTLADLENVEYVQFLINGENPEKYTETDSIKTLFRRNHVYVE